MTKIIKEGQQVFLSSVYQRKQFVLFILLTEVLILLCLQKNEKNKLKGEKLFRIMNKLLLTETKRIK